MPSYSIGFCVATTMNGSGRGRGSPRAAVHLAVAAKGAARLEGRDFVVPDDVMRMATPVLQHRLLLSPEAELERFRVTDVIENAIAAVPVPR